MRLVEGSPDLGPEDIAEIERLAKEIDEALGRTVLSDTVAQPDVMVRSTEALGDDDLVTFAEAA